MGSRDGTRDGRPVPAARVRMTGTERREQLIQVGRALLAAKGFDGTSIEEVAHRAGVSKPVVYEHFGGKEGLYAVVVDREMQSLLGRITAALSHADAAADDPAAPGPNPRVLLESAACALLDYIEDSTDGFRILVRASPVATDGGTFSGLLNDIASRVEHILGRQFGGRGYDKGLAGLYSQALVGMVALTGQWWLEEREPAKDQVVAHLVNLAWNGLRHLEHAPRVPVRRPSSA